MANKTLNTSVPQVYVPSFSVPKVNRYYVPSYKVSTPFKSSYTPIERRHVKDLGDIILGHPISGTRQLQQTLIDNDMANLIDSPILGRIAGLHYWAKERLFDPFKENSVPKAAGIAFINSLESIGQSLDLLSNPVKSLMPWAGGGKDGDFLRSMGWLEGEYREQYQWNTGNFVVDLAGEILSDPLNLTKIGSKIALNKSGLWDELSMNVRNMVRNRWGDVVANNMPESLVRSIIEELEKDVSNIDDSKIVTKIKEWAIREQDMNLLTLANTQSSKDAIRFKEQILDPFTKVLDLKQQDAFLKDLLDIKTTRNWEQFKAIRGIGKTAEMLDRQLLYVSLGMNPIIATNWALYKTISPLVQTTWTNLIKTKQDFDLAGYFDNTPASIRRLKRAVLLKNEVKNKNVFSKFKYLLDNKELSVENLVEEYKKLINTVPFGLRTKENIDKYFIIWLKKQFPELRYVADLAQDTNLKEFLSKIEIGKELDDLYTGQLEQLPDLFDPKIVNKVKQFKDTVDVVSDMATQSNVIEEAAIQQRRETILNSLNHLFKKDPNTPLKDYPILERLDFIDKYVLRSTGPDKKIYGFNKFKEFLNYLDTDQVDSLYTALQDLGLYITPKDSSLIDLYLQYKKEPKPELLKKMEQYLREVVADDYSMNNIDNLTTMKKVLNIIGNTELETDPVVRKVKFKVKQLEDNIKTDGIRIQQAIESVFKDEYPIIDVSTQYTHSPITDDIALRYLEALDAIDTYDGGDVMYTEYFTNWTASYKNVMKDAGNVKDVRQFYDNLENFKSNVDRLYWRLHNPKDLKLQEAFKNIDKKVIYDLHEALNTVEQTAIPNIINTVGMQDLYSLQLGHKANYNMLKLQLETLFSTSNPKAWDAYTNPNSDIRKSLESICTLFANAEGVDSAAVNSFAKEINDVLTYLDATTSLNTLMNSIPTMTRYPLSYRVKNALEDRILNLISEYNLNNTDLKDITADDAFEKLSRDLGYILDDPSLKLAEMLDDYDGTFTKEVELFHQGMLEYYPDAYEIFLRDFESSFKNYFQRYLNSLLKLQLKSEYVTIGTIIDSTAIDIMNSLGGFEADVIKALEDFKATDNEVILVKNFIQNITGDYVQSEILKAERDAEEYITQLIMRDAIKDSNFAKDYTKLQKEIVQKELANIRNLDNTLARASTNAWREIENINNYLKEVHGTAGGVKTADGVKRIKNILGYLTKNEIDTEIQYINEDTNIFLYAVSNGWVGFKKEISKDFVWEHKLNPMFFSYIGGVNDNVYVQFYKNFENYFKYVSNYGPVPDNEINTIREHLIKLASENNERASWLPKHPVTYFNGLSNEDILTWDQLVNGGLMEDKTITGQEILKKYRQIKAPALDSMQLESTTNLTHYCSARQKLLKNIELTDADWQELVNGTPNDYISILTDVYTDNLDKYTKSVASMQNHKLVFETYINKNKSAYNNLNKVIDISKDNRALKDVVDWDKLSDFEKEQLNIAHITKDTIINSDEFQKYLALERNRNIAMSIRNATAKELRGYIDNYTEGVMFYVSNGVPFKWTKKDLEEAGIVIKRLANSDIYAIRRIDNINRGYKFTWRMGKPIFPELQQVYTDAFEANRNYIGFKGMDVPNEILTGERVNTKEYRAMLQNKKVQDAIGDSLEQKVYSKLSKNGRNNFFYGDFAKPNLVFVGDTGNAYNTMIDYTLPTLVEQGIVPVFKNNRLDLSAYLGSTLAIKEADKKTKFLQLFFNDDFSLDNPMFRHGLENATDEEIKSFFARNNWVPCLLKEDRLGNPRVYKIYINNQKQLADAITAKAVVVPYDIYSTMVSAVNDSLLTDRVLNAYTKYIVGTFKTIYLTSVGFLLRNGLDSLVYKNMNATDGLPGMLDTFRYEYEARKMLKEYNDTITEILKRGDGQFKISNLEEVLNTMTPDKQLEFRLTDRFIHSKASSGLAEAMEQYYRAMELREGVEIGGKSLWSSINADIIHGTYSPITIVNNLNSNIEQTARYGLFLNLIHNGVEPGDAIKKVIDTHFNYDLKGTNLEVLEQIFWFSTFPINNFCFYINEGLTKNPELLKAQLDAMELSYNNKDITWEDVKKSNYLRYNATVGNVVIKVNGKNIVIKTGSSVFDFFNLLFNPTGEINERVNPFLAVMLGIDNVSELNPLTSTYSRAKQFIKGNSLIPSVYSPLYENTYTKLPKVAKAYEYYKNKKGRWNFNPKKNYFKNPDNMKRMRYKFTTYRYYFGRSKNYRRWLQSSTSIEPYWHNQNYKRLRSSRARSYKEQIKKI